MYVVVYVYVYVYVCVLHVAIGYSECLSLVPNVLINFNAHSISKIEFCIV